MTGKLILVPRVALCFPSTVPGLPTGTQLVRVVMMEIERQFVATNPYIYYSEKKCVGFLFLRL